MCVDKVIKSEEKGKEGSQYSGWGLGPLLFFHFKLFARVKK
jgi:hypothetical protein